MIDGGAQIGELQRPALLVFESRHLGFNGERVACIDQAVIVVALLAVQQAPEVAIDEFQCARLALPGKRSPGFQIDDDSEGGRRHHSRVSRLFCRRIVEMDRVPFSYRFGEEGEAAGFHLKFHRLRLLTQFGPIENPIRVRGECFAHPICPHAAW